MTDALFATAKTRLRKAIRRLAGRLSGEPPEIAAWRERAEVFDARAVFNAGHSEAELDSVTSMQKAELYPRLRGLLSGNERVGLDLGCGTGRFSADLADLISGRVIAVDPVPRLLELAPRSDRVEYRLMKAGRIPCGDATVDLIWTCLVLGGIHGETLASTLREIDRVLKPGGLVFLVENTSTGTGSTFWAFRSVDKYRAILPGIPLDHLGDYVDLGERISTFAGRKPQACADDGHRPMRVLFLAHDYAPVGGGGVQRPLHLVRSLSASGHAVHVLAVDKDPGPMRDESLFKRHPADVPITRYRLPSIDPAIDLFRRAKLSRLPTLVLPADLYVDASLFHRATTRAALKVARTFRPDVVIASGPPLGIFEAGRRVAHELGAALVLDMRDPGVEPLMGSLPSLIAFRWARSLQRRSLSAADLVVVTAPTLQTVLERIPEGRPRRVVTITNGYDASLTVDEVSLRRGVELCRAEGMKTVAFVGRLFTSDTTGGSRRGALADRLFESLAVGRQIFRGDDVHAGPWFRALTILAERRKDLWGKLQTVFVGDIPNQGRAFPRALEAFPVRFCGYQPLPVAVAAMRAADGLLLFNLSTSDDSPSFVVHGKVFEYLAAGPPILAMCGPGDCADIIRQTGAGIWVHDRQPEEMADHLERWLDGGTLPINRDANAIARYDRTVLGRRFVEEVERARAEHRAKPAIA